MSRIEESVKDLLANKNIIDFNDVIESELNVRRTMVLEAERVVQGENFFEAKYNTPDPDYMDDDSEEDIEEAQNEDGRGRYKVTYLSPDKKTIGNDRFESKAEANKYAKDLKKKGYKEVTIGESFEYVSEGVNDILNSIKKLVKDKNSHATLAIDMKNGGYVEVSRGDARIILDTYQKLDNSLKDKFLNMLTKNSDTYMKAFNLALK